MTGRRWVVRAGDGDDVAAIVKKAAPGDEVALADGRVFLARRRVVSGEEKVAPGDTLEIHAARPGGADVVILGQRDDVVAVEKPAGIATIADHHGARGTLVERAARALGKRVEELHATSRLDVGVSGVVLLALTPRARERLAAARTRGDYARLYVGISTASPTTLSGVWDAPIGRHEDPRLRRALGRDPAPAQTTFRVAEVAGSGASLLRLEPLTGRTHQLRIHAAHAGAPLVGDTSYGGVSRVVLATGVVHAFERILLHAHRVSVPDRRGNAWTATSPLPAIFHDSWVELGGDPESLAVVTRV